MIHSLMKHVCFMCVFTLIYFYLQWQFLDGETQALIRAFMRDLPLLVIALIGAYAAFGIVAVFIQIITEIVTGRTRLERPNMTVARVKPAARRFPFILIAPTKGRSQ